MVSGIGPKDELEKLGIQVIKDLPGVGAQLWNHPLSSVSFQVKDGVELSSNAGALSFGLSIISEPPSQSNDVMLHTLGVFNVTTGEALPTRTVCALELPNGSSWLRLASADPTVQPSFNYRYFHHDNDIRRMRNAVRLAVTILESGAYRGTVEERTASTDEPLASDETLDEWIRETVGSSRNVSGTCKMGPDSDPMAAVDQHCRVKGVTGLWVADSSIISQVTRANTNATAIMIGERVADWVAGA